MIQPKALPIPAPPPTRVRGRKFTARKRRAHARRARYANCVRVVAFLALAALPVMLYVMLTSNITGLNYAISHATSDREALLEEAQTLDDKIAHLESRDRLGVIALKLGMREPQNYAIVPYPAVAQPKPRGLAFLEWFKRP